MSPMNLDATIYTKQLFKFKYGTPLYYPDPAESYDVVRIGDVGYITDYGGFIRLFNVCYPADHPINNLRVPDGFVQLDEKCRESHRSLALPPGAISSMDVKEVHGGISIDCTTLPVDFEVLLSCKRKEGAALIIKRAAVREMTARRKAFRELMLKSYADWYSYIIDELQVDDSSDFKPEDIRLVIGHILTNEWSTAIVADRTEERKISFKGGISGASSASVWGSWTSDSPFAFPKQFGPTPLPPALPDDDDASTDCFIQAEPRVEETKAQLNQCIFLTSYRVKDRGFGIKTIRARAEAKDDDKRGFNEGDHYPMSIDVRLDGEDESDVDSIDCNYDVFDSAWSYIFENTDAEVAILEDNDVFLYNPTSGSADGATAPPMEGTDANPNPLINVKIETINGVKIGSFDSDVLDFEPEKSPFTSLEVHNTWVENLIGTQEKPHTIRTFPDVIHRGFAIISHIFLCLLSALLSCFSTRRSANNTKGWTTPVGEFRRPTDTDLRSQCPALNALANHGHLPRDGRNITAWTIVKHVNAVYGLSVPLASLITYSCLAILKKPLYSRVTLEDFANSRIEHPGSSVHTTTLKNAEPGATPVRAHPPKYLLENANKGSYSVKDFARICVEREREQGMNLQGLRARSAELEISLTLNVFAGVDGKVSQETIASWWVGEQIPEGLKLVRKTTLWRALRVAREIRDEMATLEKTK